MKVPLCSILIFTLFIAPFAYPQNVPEEAPVYRLLLVGDVGMTSSADQQATFQLLQQHVQGAGKNSTLLFLGDNFSMHGLPEEDSASRPSRHYAFAGENLKLYQQLLSQYPGRSFFIAGEHDWDDGGEDGWRNVLHQEKLLDSLLQNADFVPEGGCPGPYEIALNDQLVLILLNSQWFFHAFDKPGAASDCDTKTVGEVSEALSDALARNMDKQVIVASHHPLYSYGPHGGFVPFKQHLFPLTAVHPSLFLPLPGVGSLYAFSRKVGVSPQDLNHVAYRYLRKGIANILKQHPNVVHVAAHEHSLQHIVYNDKHLIVSGAASQTNPVRPGERSRFVDSGPGFAEISLYPNGEMWVTFWNSHAAKKPLYQALLSTKVTPSTASSVAQSTLSLKDSTIVVKANDQPEISNFYKSLYGHNYREVWDTQVPLPLFDIGKEQGGLTIVQKGGGGQTSSLRLEAKDGRQYVLRSINKFPERNLPPLLASPFVVNLLKDQTLATHPYGALVVPPLADAVGVFHTNPQIVYIPDDPRLGKYQAGYGNMMALYEERPDGDWSQAPFFGRSDDIVSTTKMLEKIQEDNDDEVDAKAYLRARLLDLVIGDWDRHEDNWRWARFEKESGASGEWFVPIPRDRDQVFYVNQGLIPKLASQDFALPMFQGFDHTIRNIRTQTTQSKDLDRLLLAGLSQEDWVSVAQQMQAQLTDDIIEKAVHQMPDTIVALSGQEILDKMKARRNDLPSYATQYYTFLAKQVNVVGSDKHEHFKVDRVDNRQTRVRIEKTKKDGEPTGQIVFDRTFFHEETKEIRLYGLGGHDRFSLTGEVNKGIKIRIVGGPDKDSMTDSSHVRGPARQTKIYDTKKGTKLSLGKEAKDLTSRDQAVNRFHYRTYQYNYIAPLITAGYNRDDGLFLGGGVFFKTQGFRKFPYATQHTIIGSYAIATSAYNFRYSGDYNQLFGKYDLLADVDIRSPNYVNNFFGLGNESEYEPDEQDINFYRYRFKELNGQLRIRRYLTPYSFLAIGPTYQRIKLENTPGRFITDYVPPPSTDSELFTPKQYAGVVFHYELNRLDNYQPRVQNTSQTALANVLGSFQRNTYPTRGFFWQLDGEHLQGLDQANDLTRVSSELEYYFTIRIPSPITLATRVGGGHIFNDDFAFFQAYKLGGLTTLRGFRRTRFYGQSSFYHNVELRMNLIHFRTYLAPFSMGILAFHDIGRVWLSGEASDEWHRGYGAGVYFSPFNLATISLMWGFSEEDSLPLLRFGFLF